MMMIVKNVLAAAVLLQRKIFYNLVKVTNPAVGPEKCPCYDLVVYAMCVYDFRYANSIINIKHVSPSREDRE